LAFGRRLGRLWGAAVMGLGDAGCYQSVTLGFANSLTDSPGHGLEAQYNVAFRETGGEDWVAGLIKVSVAGGPWGMGSG
jgi:hypothetical protein